MKLGSCIHLEEFRSTLCSILRLDLLFTVHLLMFSFCIQVIFSELIRARAMKLVLCIHLEELRSTLCSILRLDLLFTDHLVMFSFCFQVIFSETIAGPRSAIGRAPDS